ncbi:threonine/serine exporter ThrE [Corynebacterium sp. ES2715-CONJ3]|uniref:threonine/serine exporter ThrE n=1 Tax=Corynebacterium sp. ES2715-CONJ3 TaxID=2974028 RepID=UPI002169CA65|nr:threonine/serine exporter family protein [Corynebacterium sp. ES2715-CONJ3]MCS4491907.1 threonine/serine exporter family protein [Corynebacterium sp. ES2715-CONJ3]
MQGGRYSTIDTAKAAPPPSPLAPIDLTNPVEVAGVMDLAARIGDIFLSAGTSNRDTVAYIQAVTTSYGLHYTHVDITLNTITIFSTIGVEKKVPLSVFRVVSRMNVDFSKLSEIDRLIRSIRGGATPPQVAEKILNELFQTPSRRTFRRSLLGWGGMGAAVAVGAGGGFAAAVISFIIAVLIQWSSAVLARHNLPTFFQMLLGGFITTVPAALTYQITLNNASPIFPSHIIAAGIVVMLASLSLVQSMQDGMMGAPVTASARFFETMLSTGAIVAGVGAGLQVSEFLGITLPPLENLSLLSFTSATVKLLAGGFAAFSFAVACRAEFSSTVAAAFNSMLGLFVYYFLVLPFGLSEIIGAAIAASVIGLAGGLIARRFLIPPLITAVSGITPLLPGLAIYRGMYAALNEQVLLSFTNISVALSVAAALASGVVFGEWMARRIRRKPRLNFYGSFKTYGKPVARSKKPPLKNIDKK